MISNSSEFMSSGAASLFVMSRYPKEKIQTLPWENPEVLDDKDLKNMGIFLQDANIDTEIVAAYEGNFL